MKVSAHKNLVFVWENFGPIHADRCEAVATHFTQTHRVFGIELSSTSKTYDWNPEGGENFKKITLFQEAKYSEATFIKRTFSLLKALIPYRGATVYFCHYERPEIFVSALIMRLTGSCVVVMNDSKFDDYRRSLLRELGKLILYLPYHAAIAAGIRSREYMNFLGFRKRHVYTNYNSLSLARIRRLANVSPPDLPLSSTLFTDRNFIIVARLVPKKNIKTALLAYHKYLQYSPNPRKLDIYGSGPLENSLQKLSTELGIAEKVIFHGFQQTAKIAPAIARSVALLLPSKEEQYGNVVIEAQALGIPVILSENCGARDLLIRNGVNGFVIEPDNPDGMAYFMKLLSEDQALWKAMSSRAPEFANRNDVSAFVEAVYSSLQLK